LFKQITIVGTGLIGGSLGLALKRAPFRGRIVGCDEPAVLAVAQRRKAIDRGEPDCGQALRGSELVVLATPVGAIIDFLDRFGPALGKGIFVTDVGSTKEEIVARAQKVFGRGAAERFLGGHPMAGRERGGIEHAEAGLFRGAPWFVTPLAGQALDRGPAAEWLALLERLGTRVTTMSAERHDRIVAFTSHLPQMVSTALAATLAEFRERSGADIASAGGRALQEMTRLAASPYDMWRDIALTNTANLGDALLQMEQKLAHLRENLRTRELEEEFVRAREALPATEGQRTPRRSAKAAPGRRGPSRKKTRARRR